MVLLLQSDRLHFGNQWLHIKDQPNGYVRIYKNVNNTWTQIGSDINGEATGDESGFSVSLSSDGSVVAIGAPYNDENGNDSKFNGSIKT